MEGYNAICINSLYQNPFKHSALDKLEKLDIALLQKVSKAVLAAALLVGRDCVDLNRYGS